MNTPIDTVRALVDALDTAANGLEWYRDHSPDVVDGSDDEMDAQIAAALAAGRALLAAQAAQPPTNEEWLKRAMEKKTLLIHAVQRLQFGGTAEAFKAADDDLDAHLRAAQPQSDTVYQAKVSGEAATSAGSWVPVSERMPEDGAAVLVYTPPLKGEDERIDFEWRDDGAWGEHLNSFDHFMCVTGGKGCLDDGTPCTGPSEDAPYTHWMPLPAPPARNGLAEGQQPNKKDSAPVVQVVEPLTAHDVTSAMSVAVLEHGEIAATRPPDTGPTFVTVFARRIQRACARKWGLTLKENT